MATSKWQTKANKLWDKKAKQVTGDGQFALLAPCEVLTVTLWKTIGEAEESKELIHKTGCGESCTPDIHVIVDLDTLP